MCSLRIVAILFVSATLSIRVASEAAGAEFSLRPVRTLECGQKSICALATDSGQRLVAVGCADGSVSLWDLATSKQLRAWRPSESAVIDLAFSPQTPLVASVSFPKSLTLFDAKSNQQVWQTDCPVTPMRICFSRKGSLIGVGSVVGRAAVYRASAGQRIAKMQQTLPASGGITFSDDGRFLFVAAMPLKNQTGEARVLRCDAETGEVVGRLATHPTLIRRLRLSPTGNRLGSVDDHGGVHVWDLRANRLEQSWKLSVERTRCLQFLDDETLIVAGEGRAVVLRLGETEPVGQVSLPPGRNELVVMPSRGLVTIAAAKQLHLFAFDRKALQESDRQVADQNMAVRELIAAADVSEFDAQDNQPGGDVEFDGLVEASQFRNLLGKPMIVKMQSGLLVTGAKLEELQFDRRAHGLRFLKYILPGGRSVTVKAADLYWIIVGSTRYHLRYFQPKRQLFLIDSKAALTVASERLAASNRSPREFASSDDQQQATREHRAFLEEAVNKLSGEGNFRIEETASTLILTDLPPANVQSIKTYVDSMNGELNRIFGIPTGDSIWRGKAVLCVFSTKTRFGAFEEKVMNNPNHAGRAGVRGGPRRFIQTAIATQFNPQVARGLCWGYSLGFARRLHSDAQGVPWLNMGIANAMQSMIAPNPRAERAQRDRVTQNLRRNSSLLGLLKATRLDQDRWPICGEIVKFLIAQDSVAFGQMFRDAKMGLSIEDALMQNFGLTLDELAGRFGRSLGVANVSA